MSLKHRSAFVPHDLPQPLLGRTDGPLRGLTFAVKDMYAILGQRVSGGSPAWLAAQSPATANSAVVQRILDAGGTVIGKTVCDEFFYSVVGANYHYGTPLNPRAPLRVPGGSSSGSASAVASGACDAAIGSDTAGSVRIPASHCGLYGIRVTHGRIDMTGAMAMAPSFDAGGWLAATPGVFKLVGDAILQPATRTITSFSRAIVLDDLVAIAQPAIAAAVRSFIPEVAKLFTSMKTETLARGRIDEWREAMRIRQAFEVWRTFGDFVLKSKGEIGPGIRERVKIASEVKEDQVRLADKTLDEVRSRVDEITGDDCVLVLPTSPRLPPLKSADAAELEAYRIDVMRLVCTASISGHPQVTIPFGTIQGVPIGLSFLGPKFSEEALLRLAASIAPQIGVDFE